MLLNCLVSHSIVSQVLELCVLPCQQKKEILLVISFLWVQTPSKAGRPNSKWRPVAAPNRKMISKGEGSVGSTVQRPYSKRAWEGVFLVANYRYTALWLVLNRRNLILIRFFFPFCLNFRDKYVWFPSMLCRGSPLQASTFLWQKPNFGRDCWGAQ